MKQRFVGLAAALALCCTVSGAMLERAVCCPAPPGLAHIEKHSKQWWEWKKGTEIGFTVIRCFPLRNMRYVPQRCAPEAPAGVSLCGCCGGWRTASGVWCMRSAESRSHPRQYKMRRDKADERKNGCFSGAHSTASGLAQRGMHCVANADGKLGKIFRCRNDGMPKAKNASGTCRGPGGVLCWLKSVCGNNGCISRQLP